MPGITNAEIAALPTYTSSELLKLVNYQISQILASGQAYTADGNMLTRADLEALFKRRDALQTEAQIEAGNGGGIALGVFGERR